MDDKAASRETNVRLVLLSLIAVLVALVLFWVAEHDEWLTAPLRSVASNVAGLVLATGLLTAAWDLVGRRRFAAEVLAKAKLSADIVDAGMLRVTDQYLEDVEWAELFDGAVQVDIVVAYARTWRNTHANRLRAVAANPKATIRVFLPDPSDADTVKILADRFDLDVRTTEQTIREAVAYFSALTVRGGAQVEVYTRAGDAVFSCYRFGQRAVLTLYSHSRDRVAVPTWVVGRGKIFKFVTTEIDVIHGQSNRVN